MSSSKGYPENRQRPLAVRVMLTEAEKKKLVRTAKKAGLPLSVWLRTVALEKAGG